MSDQPTIPLVNYSCQSFEFREGESFVTYHSLGIVISGIMELNDGQKKKLFKKGDLYSSRKNHLLKFIKYPPAGGDFKSLSLYFDEGVLRDFSKEYGYTSEKKHNPRAFISLEKNKELLFFMQSLLRYEGLLNNKKITVLLRIKQKEALALLLEYDMSLKDILFDFCEPHKIDLEAFMNKNFRFNVHLDRFAYLTGRSLATFKRDFQKTFGVSPRLWLQQKRLEEAHYLIAQKGKNISDIYLDLGFENLSHFSYAFKKQFGIAPSAIQNNDLAG